MQKEVFMVEFLFDFEDATELRPVGIFSSEAMARTVAMIVNTAIILRRPQMPRSTSVSAIDAG